MCLCQVNFSALVKLMNCNLVYTLCNDKESFAKSGVSSLNFVHSDGGVM